MSLLLNKWTAIDEMKEKTLDTIWTL